MVDHSVRTSREKNVLPGTQLPKALFSKRLLAYLLPQKDPKLYTSAREDSKMFQTRFTHSRARRRLFFFPSELPFTQNLRRGLSESSFSRALLLPYHSVSYALADELLIIVDHVRNTGMTGTHKVVVAT